MVGLIHHGSIDHIAVTAPSLEAGAEYLRRELGVSPQPGGKHERMGTHNLLLRLGDAAYLEVIAPDPSAPRPPHPRWFALDGLEAGVAPRLAAWIVRTRDIQGAVASLPEPVGPIEAMSRGDLRWRITIPLDGSLPLGGAAPFLIEWDVPAHPARRLEDRGCSLRGLEVFHPEPGRVEALLRSLALDAAVTVGSLPAGARPFLVARIGTPAGVRSLGGPR